MHQNWTVLCLTDWLRRCLPGDDDPPPTLIFQDFRVDLASEASMYPGLVRQWDLMC